MAVSSKSKPKGGWSTFLESTFQVTKRGSTVSREVIAGLTTFAAMSYVIVVNPQILSATGMDQSSLITATAISAIIGTLIMALWANLPVALAAGMGSNLIFAFVVVGQLGVSWQTALTMVLITGVIFVVLSLTRYREKIVAAFPKSIQIGLQCSIGVFIAYLGLKNGGIMVTDENTYISFGDLTHPSTVITYVGLLLTTVLMVKRVPAAFLISIAILTVAGAFITTNGKALTQWPSQLVDTPQLKSEILFAFNFKEFLDHFFILLPITLYFFMADFFSTAATLIGVSRRGNLLTDNGEIPNAKQAFTADAIATVSGSALGTSTVTSYIESVTGIESGGRTGLTGIVVVIMFFLAMFFWPILAVIPTQATAPTLILVGVLMLEGVTKIETQSPEQTITPLTMLLITACTADLMAGFSTGCFIYTLIILTTKQWHKLSPMLIGLNISLLLYLGLSTSI
ncbi:NCS2 family permease [Porticoccus sp. W117]|uniref:NCS2 family permease n=1 Tax=Porticoccus sp. W117 TaxID=3054777 RepID=UPI002591A6A7|nr:NCS2 family permease [Porticoccus sp. W117]MDM3872350.1 NCS2 family permease [Porticoccus sp. W117]